MKLFIWEGDGVLEDYTSGMIVALAPDLKAALKAIEKQASYCMNSFPNNHPSQVVDLGECKAKKTRAWLTYGGG